VEAAHAAGALMRANADSVKKINEATRHDIKLELDVRCQRRIERTLRRRFPDFAVLGEEGISGDTEAEYRWVVDPIDGTVNFAHGIPHACVSIALQTRSDEWRVTRDAHGAGRRKRPGPITRYPSPVTLLGVVYDPFCDELWTAVRGQPAQRNGRRIRVSRRRQLRETLVGLGFAKYSSTLKVMLPVLNRLVPRVRKIRLMGAAALSMVYVASGRFDAYTEHGVRLWDIAAGGIILECAGGEFWHELLPGEPFTYRVVASNGLLRRELRPLLW
jgi:myo-inositol-1(or 4)-monophosphatase